MPTGPVILLVDCDRSVLSELEPLISGLAVTVACDDFAAARMRILDEPPDLLVTNLRLGAYNGLHLVMLARSRSQKTRCLVYDQSNDVGLARAVKQTGAFFEPYERLAANLPAYITAAELPSNDRRDTGVDDRRHTPRGGRRSTDRVS